MAFIKDGSQLEFALTYLHLSNINYNDNLPIPTLNSNSEKEEFLIPVFHYISPIIDDNWRFGFSLTAPGGLAKRWKNPYQKAYAEKFSIKILELNPNLSYKINENFAIGLGLRAVYTTGEVKSDTFYKDPQFGDIPLRRDMDGDSIDFGYNIALSYKPIENLVLSTTYRSKVDLSLNGDAKLSGEDYKANINISLPAFLDISAAYTFNNTTIEATYERTYWSSYKNIDFNYNRPLSSTLLETAFDKKQMKNWKNANAYRLGIMHKINDKLILLGGFAYDKSPAPNNTLGFELPDSNSYIYSAGLSYKLDKKITLGLGLLYDKKNKRKVNQRTNPNDFTDGISGEFSDASARLVTASFLYEF